MRSIFGPVSSVTSSIYKFDNNLTRNVIYGVTPPQKRIQMHRKIAQKIESLFSDDLDCAFALLSHHYYVRAQILCNLFMIFDRSVHYILLK